MPINTFCIQEGLATPVNQKIKDPKEMPLIHCAQSCLLLCGPMECSPHVTEEPGGYSPWGCKELDTTKQLTHT